MNDYESLFKRANSALARIDFAIHEMQQQIREREAALSALSALANEAAVGVGLKR